MGASPLGLVYGLGLIMSQSVSQTGASPPIVHCFFGPIVLTFEPGSSQITDAHKEMLELAITEQPKCDGPMMIEGFLSNNEPSSLRLDRVMAVLEYLRRRGIDPREMIPALSGEVSDPGASGRARHVAVILHAAL